MKFEIDLPEYDGDSLDVIWDEGSNCSMVGCGEQIIIKANSIGLISMAKQMLYMAHNNLPAGSHIHYDDSFWGTSDFELIVEKTD